MSQSNSSKILITICARKGSKGVLNKNIRPLNGKPLILHTIDLARQWGKASEIIVSTDSEEITEVARQAGAKIPFMRPASLATDTASKLDTVVHALETLEKTDSHRYDVVLDMDPTSPIRTLQDIENGWKTFSESSADLCFSVVKARKNPYFNMVENDASGNAVLVKRLDQGAFSSRQAAPSVYEMNASMYFYKASFLRSHPRALWDAKTTFFLMPPESAFDIDEERDFVINEALLRLLK